MTYAINKVQIWTGPIEDRPGGIAEKLEILNRAGANLEFVLARRAPEMPGGAAIFVAPLKGAAQLRAAQAAGLATSDNLHALRLEGGDRPGLGACIAQTLAQAGINLRALMASVLGRRCIVHIAFDNAADAVLAGRLLRKAL
jgi:hypothetical protein